MAAPAPASAPAPAPLSAEPLGPAAVVFIDVDGEEPDAARFRELVKSRLVGRTLTGLSLPLDDGNPDHVLTHARLLALAQLGHDVAWPVCNATPASGLWKLVLAPDRPSKGKARLSTTLSFLRCSTWEPFAEAEVDFKNMDLALGAAVGQVETVLAKGRTEAKISP